MNIIRSGNTTYLADRYVYTGIAASLFMMSAILWMPSSLGVMHDAFAFRTVTLGHLAFAESIGFLLATIFTGTVPNRQLARVINIGCALLIVTNIILAFTPAAPSFLLPVRAVAGLGAGVGFGYGLKICGLSSSPTRSFGLFTGAMSVTMIIGFQLLAHATDAYGRRNGAIDATDMRTIAAAIWIAFATFSVAAWLLFVTNNPSGQLITTPNGPTQKIRGALPAPMILLVLLAIVVAFIAQGSVWAFLQILGVSHGYAVAEVAHAMSAFAIMGIVGSLTAASVPSHLPRWRLIGIAQPVLWAGLYALYAPASLPWYIVGCAVGGFYWNFILPLNLGLLAHMDPTGRAPVLGGSMSSVGSALGPLLAGTLIQGADYRPVGWMVAVLCTIAFTLVTISERHTPATVAA